MLGRNGAHAGRWIVSTLAAVASLAVAAPVAGATTGTAPSPAGFSTVWDHGHLRVVRDGAGTYSAAAAGGSFGAAGTTVATHETDSTVHALGAPDPLRGAQWALDAVPFESTWPSTRGRGVIVAVVDTGVLGNHQDLQGNVLPGVDLVTGHGDGRIDPNGHGTHVAGIIAALAGNGAGIEGAAPDVKILPVRVLDGSGSGSSSNVAAGIIWAADHGARVVNLSLGGTVASPGTHQAIQYANSKGVVVVAAAGNGGDSGNQPTYPAAFAEPVAVAAVDQNLQHPSFSNHGAYVDVSAPGVDVLSAWGSSPTTYEYASGTSMATPYAAAEAALIVATNPKLSAAAVARDLEGSARDLGAPGTDPYFGHGLIDPHTAVLRAAPKPPDYGTRGRGYWVVASNGAVRAFGKARFYGDLRGRSGAPVVAATPTRDGGGYWLASADGSVHAFGDARNYGSMAHLTLNAPIVGMAVTPSGRGYFLLGADGGIFSFGDAKFRGSTGGMRLHAPVLDMTMTPSGKGYWMVAADGGVFTFGDAKFRGSTGGMQLSSPVASMTAGKTGYWLVAKDGGIFAFGVPFVGSLPSLGVQSLPTGVRIRALPDGRGYYILGRDGSVFTFGTAKFFGAATPLPPFVAAADLMLVP